MQIATNTGGIFGIWAFGKTEYMDLGMQISWMTIFNGKVESTLRAAKWWTDIGVELEPEYTSMTNNNGVKKYMIVTVLVCIDKTFSKCYANYYLLFNIVDFVTHVILSLFELSVN